MKSAPAPPAPASARVAAAAAERDELLEDLLHALEAATSGDRVVRLSGYRSRLARDVSSAFNDLVDQNVRLERELARVARAVGRDGRMTERVDPSAIGKRWDGAAGAVNSLVDDLVRPTNEVARVMSAVAQGDLTQKIALTIEDRPVKGEFRRIGTVVNSMVDQLSSFSAEVSRVAREVGTDGKLGGQATVRGVSGTWKDLTDSVNSMAGNLTDQVRNIALVTTAVARGDLSRKITVEARGEVAELKDTVNTMVDQLRAFADEVTRVAREVGTEGRLGGQAEVEGVSGTWKALTDNVNQLAGNLTSQVRNIAQVTTAVARGDLSQKITVEARGEVAALKDTVNTMVDQLRAFADEVTRVAREVGTEGKLGGQATVPGVSGTWKDLTDSVNFMASNLTSQVRNISQVAMAVARGDLSQKITVEAKGEVAALAGTINSMTDTLQAFADEVTRVAREVGTEGNLGGQANVPGVSGTWKDLTDNVNQLAGNLTSQVRNIAQVTTAVAKGDLSQKITVSARGEILQLKSTINEMVDQLSAFAAEVTRVAREVGTEGKLGGQAIVPGVSGTWKDLTDNVNQLAGNLTSQVRNIAQVTTAVAKGDLTRKITVELRGELLELKNTINTMVDQLSAFAGEVTRVAREVGTEGKLGGQAEVRGVSGTWRDLTTSVNSMADNLTDQVRNIAQVTTAVAQGDLQQKITVDARGEILQLKNTINKMVDQLSAFAAEVTRVAREVGTEGRLGGQAEVEGVSGTWRHLTANVNQLASNLTTQVRSIADVATSVTKGDLTRTITVEAPGELGALKDNINQMIGNLRETTTRNEEQDWLKSNLARIGAMLQGHRDLGTVSRVLMSELTPLVSAHQGAFFMAEGEQDEVSYRLLAGYGISANGNARPQVVKPGEGLVGQAAIERRLIVATDVPEGYTEISSGLGAAAPTNLVVLPVPFEDDVLAVIELASFRPLTETNQSFLERIVESVGVVLNTIIANMRTESLLDQSQTLAQELQSRQEELQHTNAELAAQNRAIEVKNAEIELARREIEERAEQLALSSRYKSEFLANMSHELRTPLNSLLILANMLAENLEGNLTDEQVEFATSIRDAGNDLLNLISDILDLSKVEAGKMDITPTPVSVVQVCEDLEQTFRPIAAERTLDFEVEIDPALAVLEITTDEHRLRQILKNLLSNACKFTEEGSVRLRVAPPDARLRLASKRLRESKELVAFSVADTGIGIEADKLLVIFEAFQQADGTTSRRYGGTGLGLNISREIAQLLGGEIHVNSAVGVGSTFTLVLPAVSQVPAERVAERLGAAGGDEVGTGAEPVAALTEDTVPLLGRRVLVVDDDVRNLYALASALERRGVEVLCAGTGAQGIEMLDTGPEVDLVLMDIMMPGMDGYETITEIRGRGGREKLPIIALTAKAMAGDREKTLQAGASDYITKPVDLEELLGLMRLWLYR